MTTTGTARREVLQMFAGESPLVLVVDDSPASLRMFNEALEDAGLTVLVSLGGTQALSIAQKIVPDIVLLDAVMPGLDGFETCEQFKLNPILADIPIIFMTGLDDTESTIKGLQCGGVDYLTKPINIDELLARIRVHLGNARLSSTANKALDTTGQHLFTVNTRAQIVWATPQTKKLFQQAKINEHWLQTRFSEQVAEWLCHKPESEQTLHLKGASLKLKIRLVEYLDNQHVLMKLFDSMAPSGAQKLRQGLPLTIRESEVLYWIGNGKSNSEIGQILSTSPRTINKHLEQVFRKLEVSNRTSAAAIAIRLLSKD
jgi:DNA-binding response OmpR family regulator/DNA-binding CsgD family transcriptional regulator